MELTKRRQACPQIIQHLWDAIVLARQQKQIATLERLTNQMRRKHNLNPSELERELNFAVRDNLIVTKTKVGCKGSKVGVEQEAYHLPEEPVEKDNDWYCFECHRGGEVILCSTCHRVYHSFCVNEDLTASKTFVCSVCKIMSSKTTFKVKRDDLNCLLSFTCLRLKDKMRDLHRMPRPEEEVWRHDYLIFQKMDLVTMEEKAKENEYSRLEEFQIDAQTIVHNVVIYYGVNSTMADLARLMLRDCIYDLGEIQQCKDCYQVSNEKNDKYWFCEPCDPPHDLVFAKQKGFPYWPAKVIRQMNGVYDVRFFGGFHQRANIEKEHIKPITTTLQQLNQKRTVSLNKALEELKKHQQLLQKRKPKSYGDKQKTKSYEDKQKSKPSRDRSRGKDYSEQSPSTQGDRTEEEEIEEEEPEAKPPAKRGRRSSSKAKRAKGKNTVLAPPSIEAEDQPQTPLEDDPETSQDMKPELKDDPVANAVEDAEASSRDDAPSSSSHTTIIRKDAPTPEDHNVVTSSTKETPCLRTSVSTQTTKKLLAGLNLKGKTEEPISCNCDTKFSKMIRDQQDRLETEFKESKERELKELEERLRNEFEDEKKLEVNMALEKLHRDLELSHRKSEEQLKLAHEQDIQKMQERLKEDISETKKKQWCYNCEQEAIYHCCWNTSYCSVECQQVHWHKEHKRTCRRKR